MRDLDRFRGCLIGGAAGDALGYAIEFWSEDRIFAEYGENGITEYELSDKGVAEISDDTQMTLFTAVGLQRGAAAGGGKLGKKVFADAIHSAYLDWLRTQSGDYPLPGDEHGCWLLDVPELFSPRAPGNTCMSALQGGRYGTISDPLNHSKGCGGVMRVAPVGLYFNDRDWEVRDVARIGAEAAAITHGHPLGWMPAAAQAQIIHEVSQDDVSIRDAVLHSLDLAMEIWSDTGYRDQFVRLIQRAVDLAGEDLDDLDAIHELGEGWVAEEALAIAVYCAVKYADDFDKAIIAAVNHKGDSDSTGAITGNILGAKLGMAGIPEKYTKNLELRDVILKVADELWKNG